MVAKKSAKPKKIPEPRPVGRPTKYRPEYCQDIIDHMKAGNSIDSFGAYLGEKYGRQAAAHRQNVHEWQATYPEFHDAIREARSYSAKFFDDIGRNGIVGNLRRVKSETPILVDGKVVIGPDGKVVVKREYEPATFGQAVYIFTRKNMHGWKDRTEISGEIKHVDPVGQALSGIFADPKLAAAAKLIAEQLVTKPKAEDE